jgi:hypothetical protein
VEQLAAGVAPQRLRIAVPITSMICAVVAPAISADVTNPRRRLCAPMASTSRGEAPASRKSRFTTSATSRPSIRVSRSSPCGENATNNAPFFCSRMASHASSAATAQLFECHSVRTVNRSLLERRVVQPLLR